jgi:hypothetical protein
MGGCEVVQGHACEEGGREHGRCRRVWPQDSASQQARSGVDLCVHTWVWVLDKHVETYVREHGRRRRVWPQDSAPHEARGGVNVWTHVGMAAREACIHVRVVAREPQSEMKTQAIYPTQPAGRLIKRTFTHMREGLSA